MCIRDSFPLVIAGQSISSTTQYATANVRVAGPFSGGVFQAADRLKFCPLSEPRLSATLTALAVAMAAAMQVAMVRATVNGLRGHWDVWSR